MERGRMEREIGKREVCSIGMFFPFLKNMSCPAQHGKGERKEGKGE